MTAPTLWDVLDAPSPVHAGDGSTSREAAARPRRSQRVGVLMALAEARQGLTAHEVCDRTTCLYATGAGTRLLELMRAGLVERTERTRMTPSGSSARVWVLSDEGRDYVAGLEGA